VLSRNKKRTYNFTIIALLHSPTTPIGSVGLKIKWSSVILDKYRSRQINILMGAKYLCN